ncbi:MAG: glycosyltransferase [Candidatus Saccharibacteria bacterium]|nr:glycosyltransferase [Candidatus Saccharibacteria bacterium]
MPTRPIKNILLLTDVFPCSNYSGAIVSSQICHFLLDAGYSLFCACIHSSGVHERIDPTLQKHIPTINLVKPPENQLEPSEYEARLKIIKKELVDYIISHEIDVIWCPLQGESLLRILNYILTEIKNIRLITQIWDPFEWYLTGLNYSLEKKSKLLPLFEKIIRKSDYCLTASPSMNDHYSEKYQIPCAPIFASYPLPKTINTAKSTDKYTIIISGQTYAKAGINSFLHALESIHWQYNGKPITIKYFGSKPEVFKKYQNHVFNCGYVSQAELVEAQQTADLLYCPYFFDKTAPVSVARESYPSKIVTYLASGSPILIHAKQDCPVYQDFKNYDCGYLLDSINEQDIVKKLKEIFTSTADEINTLIDNSKKLYTDRFTPTINQRTILKALKSIQNSPQRQRILEINNIDSPGHLWNGYDLMNYLNSNTNFLVNQICTYKSSNNDDVIKLFTTQKELNLEFETLSFESNRLSVHSCLSVSTPALIKSQVYQNADLLHFHLIHNMKLSLFSLVKMCNEKPAIISIHDPWTFTGHCVHFGSCNKYLTGCHNCPNLNTMFPIKYDTASRLWQLKQFVYNNIDVDYVVSSEYMYNLFKNSPLTKNKRIHLIPFGIDINKFTKISSKDARKHYGIPHDHIVLFHRAQQAFKGTNFFVDAMKQLKTNQKITIITCGELGLLDNIKDKYSLIELGNITDKELTYAYNACDFFVMPSIGESFGMMSIEAMSCSKPVICFNNTALPSVIHAPNCGIAVENLNSTKLMEAIKHLIDDEEDRLRRGRLSRELVKSTYDVKIYNQKMLSLYEYALKRKHNSYSQPHHIDHTPSVVTLKKELNRLTKTLFPKSSLQYKKMYYKTPIRTSLPHTKIRYDELNAQLLLDQYNHDLYNYYLEDFNLSLPSRLYSKTKHYSKLFVKLIREDPATLHKVIKKHLKLPR